MITPETELQTLPKPSAPVLQDDMTSEFSKARGTSHIFGSFWIDDTELAIPVGAIREVVNEPAAISPVPMAPDYMTGLFNLRGMIIPVIDLRRLLDFTRPDADPQRVSERKVAIIENGDKCIGLLFDRAGEVLNEPNSALVDFSQHQSGTKDVVIKGVLKLNGGDRMVQIIDPYEVLNIERIPQVQKKASGGVSHQQSDLGSRLSCVSFQLGHTWCAIDLRYVQEVRDMPPVESSPLTRGIVIGTANLRGAIIPVIDFRSFMGNEPAHKLSKEALAQRKMLVVRTAGGLAGLMVYSIDSIIQFFQRDVLPFAKLALPRGNVVSGCLVNENEQLVMLLNHDRLLSDPGLSDPARICQKAHAVSDTPTESKAASAAERRTFIVFTASSRFAMDTCAVSEVINKPDKLLKPPYALRYVEGIINLRGELITLVNLRELYDLESSEDSEDKVLIFFHQGRKYAILVDRVDEIVMTTSDKVSIGMKSGSKEGTPVTTADVAGVLQINRAADKNALVMIMSEEALVSRLIDISKASGVDVTAEFAAS